MRLRIAHLFSTVSELSRRHNDQAKKKLAKSSSTPAERANTAVKSSGLLVLVASSDPTTAAFASLELLLAESSSSSTGSNRNRPFSTTTDEAALCAPCPCAADAVPLDVLLNEVTSDPRRCDELCLLSPVKTGDSNEPSRTASPSASEKVCCAQHAG